MSSKRFNSSCGYNNSFSAFRRRTMDERHDEWKHAWRQVDKHGTLELGTDSDKLSYWFPARFSSLQKKMVIVHHLQKLGVILKWLFGISDL